MESGAGFTRRPEAPKASESDASEITDIEEIARIVIDSAFHLHEDLGPGLLESAYESFLAAALRERGLLVEQQRPVEVSYKGTSIKDAFRADLLVQRLLIVEIKSVERLAPVHSKQLLTYLRLTHAPVGLLINFGDGYFKNGIKRVINDRSKYKSNFGRKARQP